MVKYKEETIKDFTTHVSYRLTYDSKTDNIIELKRKDIIYKLYYCDYDFLTKTFTKYLWITGDLKIVKFDIDKYHKIQDYKRLIPSKLKELHSKENIEQYMSFLDL